MRLFSLSLCFALAVSAQNTAPPAGRSGRGANTSQEPINERTFAALRARQIGPAMISGRILQIAVFPDSPSHYMIALAAGNIFMTENNGTTWTPVFENYGSYSIAWITIDPKNPSIVWVGTGENNSQRAAAYGDGVYKSEDGGRTFHNVGLKTSEHIGRILVDPRDSNVVYVAAQGPLWKGGGERGLFKTTDGGKTWSPSLIKVDDYTGCTDVIMDPANPDVLLAATHQRQRSYFGIIHGGPGSALWRTMDAGKTWTKVQGGFPQGQGEIGLGRIGLNYAPSNPKIIYAEVEGNGNGGLYRSADDGITWERRNPSDQQAQYYAKVQVDPANPDRVYIMGVNIEVSDDGGRTVTSLGTRNKHVDNHDIWIDPKNNNHYMVGCDGGLYESFDRAATWIFKENLPTGQFYDVAVDEDAPFYHVYGGTQDNNSVGCAVRTKNTVLTNADCFVTNGGDGFYSRVDPKDPNTVYAASQNAGIVRFDKRTGERVSIQPRPAKGDPALRWNWDAPFIVSPHSNTRLYIGAQKLYRSDDRGDSWVAVSPDLTRQIDRNKLPLMGKVWPIDAIQKNVSTALYDNISSIAESPKKEGLIYAGTDDGLVQVTENGGKTWRKVDKPAGVPENAYVQRIVASQHDPGTVYVAYENHQNGDFKPYLIKSSDMGNTWVNISGNLPERGGVYAIAEDPVNKNLVFAGTEFGLYVTTIGGEKWMKLNVGLPTTMVRDLTIQKQMDDLVIGTFGRSIYVLDDYSPLRVVTPEMMQKESAIFPVRKALEFIPYNTGGDLGTNHFTAPNPPVGAMITYNLKEAVRTKAQDRQQRERQATQRGETAPYPTPEELRAESLEEPPAVILTIKDAKGNVVRRLDQPATAGIHRVTWDLRSQGIALAPSVPLGGGTAGGGRGGRGGAGGGAQGGRGGAGGGAGGAGGAGGEGGIDPDMAAAFGGRGGGAGAFVLPGKYTVALAKRVNGVVTDLPGSESIEVVAATPYTQEERVSMSEFQEKLNRLQKALTATQEAAGEAGTRLDSIKRAVDATPALSPKLHEQVLALQRDLEAINLALSGDRVWRAHNEGTPASISERIQAAAGSTRGTTSHPTKTSMEQYQIGSDELAVQIPKLRKLIDTDIRNLEKQLDAAGAPPTPGRLPDWKGGK
ncbi:MAG: glycosyl hydrolase [Candidatus Sulfopaludibacter sp.]|nr:glycosyl hydrolase [Candidatus Sulfopaludibacter sp.]